MTDRTQHHKSDTNIIGLFRSPGKVHPRTSDPRKHASPIAVNSHSLITPGAKEIQALSKMAATLAREVQSSKLIDVPNLIEDKLTDEAISRGMGNAKYLDSPSLAETFSVKVSEIMAKLKSRPAKIGKYVAQTGCWQKWRKDKAKQDGTSSSAGSNSKMDANGQPQRTKADEEQFADFVNEMADCIRTDYGIDGSTPESRAFSARFKDRAPVDAPVDCIRKPDCVILKKVKLYSEDTAWRDIGALVELKFSGSTQALRDAYRELLNCARMVFAAQHNRRFVLGAVLQYTTMFFFVFDRSGVLCSEAFDIDLHPEKLVRVVCGLLFVDKIRLGYDPTIERLKEGGYSILLNGVRYKCEEPLYIEKSVRGRGTGCFKTVHEGEGAVIKDAWVDDSRKRLEHEILEKVKDVEGVVKIVGHEIVQIEGKNDTTGTDRHVLAEDNIWLKNSKWHGFGLIETRTHRRIIMKPCGEPLENFANLAELLNAIKDIVKTIEDLIDRKVLHRDISLRNLILARSDPEDPTSRIRGYIIDFDYALDLDNISEDVAKGARTGTLPFMALEMLEAEDRNKVPHAYYHDLESVFYALCWLCTSQEGPNNTERSKDLFDFSKSEVAKWNGVGMDNPKLDDVRRCKASTVHNRGDFSMRVLHQFAPYFEPIRPCIAALHLIMVNQHSNVQELDEFYREEIEAAKRKLNEARKKGEPVDRTLLSIIPNSERDHRDVFDSIYGTIDKALDSLKEPPIPPCCLVTSKGTCPKLTRKEMDAKQFKAVRELVEMKEAADEEKEKEEAKAAEAEAAKAEAAKAEAAKAEAAKARQEERPMAARSKGWSDLVPGSSIFSDISEGMGSASSGSKSRASRELGRVLFDHPALSMTTRSKSKRAVSGSFALQASALPRSYHMPPPAVPASRMPTSTSSSTSSIRYKRKSSAFRDADVSDDESVSSSSKRHKRLSPGPSVPPSFSSSISSSTGTKRKPLFLADEDSLDGDSVTSLSRRPRELSPGPTVPPSICSSTCSTRSKRKSMVDDDARGDESESASSDATSSEMTSSSSKRLRRF